MTGSKKRLVGLCAALAASLLAGTALARAEARVALVIGNAAYEKLAPLSNPVIDAERMAALLVANGFDVLSCDGDAPGCYNLDRGDMTDALEEFELKARDADVALVFYAGHGMQTAKGNVLAPVNMELSCDTLDPLKSMMLDNVMDALGNAKEKIIIIDACRNDPFQAQACAQRGARPLSFDSIAVPETDSRFLIMSSTKPGQYALDGLPGQHSPFAESLFYWMEKEPNSFFDQMLDRVAKRLIERSTEAKFTQVPEILIRGGAPETCLAGNGCAMDPEAAVLKAEVEGLRAENARSQEYEEIVTTLLRSAGYASIEELPADQRESFFTGIVSASRALAERNDSAGERALAALKQGDENAAEALFEEELAERAKGAEAELTKAAESARHIASLSRPKDVAKAAKYFAEAAKYDPDDIQTWMDLAQTAAASGNTSESLRAYREASALARDTGSDSQRIWAAFGQGDIVRAQGRLDRALEFYSAGKTIAERDSAANPDSLDSRRNIYAANLFIGDVRMEQGNTAGATEAYEAGLEIAKYLAAADPSMAEWQRDISITNNKLGDARAAQGRLAEAEAAYEAGLVLVQTLMRNDPNNIGWQRDVSISHERTGDARLAQGNIAGALEAYRASLAMRQKISAVDPNNTEWRRDLSISHERMGDLMLAQGNLAGALASYEASIAIRETLVEADPDNTVWQRDLEVSYNRIGDIQKYQGNLAGALASYERGLGFAERLAATDPQNTTWQRDLSISHTKFGDVRIVQGNLTGALESYRTSQALVEKLASSDPNNVGWQRDVSIGHNRIGDVLRGQANLVGALEQHEKSLAIVEKLSAKDGRNVEFQRDIEITQNKIGDTLFAMGENERALKAYLAGLEIAERLAASDPQNSTWRRDVSVSLNRAGDVQKAMGDLAAAAKSFEQARDMATALAQTDQSNTEWKRDLAISFTKIGDIRVAEGKFEEALQAFKGGLEISLQLAAVDAFNTDWQRDLSLTYSLMGDVQLRLGQVADSVRSYLDGLNIANRLAAADPGNAEWQWDLYVNYWRLADTGQDTASYFRKALDVIERMQTQGQLSPSRAVWVENTKQRLADAVAAQGGQTSAN